MNDSNMVSQAERILRGSAPLFWVMSWHALPDGAPKGRVERILFSNSGQLKDLARGEILHQLLEELPKNPELLKSVLQQHRLMSPT